MRVFFTASAERQLDSLHHYIAERAGERTADDDVSRIVAFCEGLSTFPCAAPLVTTSCRACEPSDLNGERR